MSSIVVQADLMGEFTRRYNRIVNIYRPAAS